MSGRLARLYTPGDHRCGCPPECICKRNAIGPLLRWYIPGRFHNPLTDETERARAEAENLAFRPE